MSLIARALNTYLRLTEKPMLTKAPPEKLRRSLAFKSKLLFHPPRGTRYDQKVLHHDGRQIEAVTVECAPNQDPLLLYFHGGAYIFGSPHTHKAMVARLARLTGCRAVLPFYRLAPDHPHPAPFEDGLAAYQAVMDHPGGVILGGDSAGGGLVLALLGEITRLGLPQPLGTFAFAPLTDMSFSAPSILGNDAKDVILPGTRTCELAALYLQGADPADPRCSPIHAQFEGAGPVWITVADSEILLDDSTRMADVLRDQGVEVDLIVEQNLPHVWPIFHNTLPEARATLQALANWVAALSPSGKR
ncbi:MAG: alpha/beta hydrolase [Roseovarius sp.]